MKGSLHTDELMREVIAKRRPACGPGGAISHVFIMDVPTYAETLFITDAAINIFPDLDTKRDIVQNAIDLLMRAGPRRAARGDPLGGRDGQPEDARHARRGGACARWPIAARSPAALLDGPLALRQRDQPGGGTDQGHRLPGGGPRADPGRARSRGRQHAGQEPVLHGQCRCRRDRAGRARADHPDQPRRQRPHPHRFLRGRRALCPRPPRRRPPRWRRHDAHGRSILVINAGSSSIKFQLFDVTARDGLELAFKGQIEGIGTRPRLRAKDAAGDGADRRDATRRRGSGRAGRA